MGSHGSCYGVCLDCTLGLMGSYWRVLSRTVDGVEKNHWLLEKAAWQEQRQRPSQELVGVTVAKAGGGAPGFEASCH
jgi:hypothetical protein